MNEIIIFFKDIFMIKPAYPESIGLSQFKPSAKITPPDKKNNDKNKEIKLSDLMRRN